MKANKGNEGERDDELMETLFEENGLDVRESNVCVLK